MREAHAALLRTYRHVRYMWLPHTDAVVVVVSDPCAGKQEQEQEQERDQEQNILDEERGPSVLSCVMVRRPSKV